MSLSPEVKKEIKIMAIGCALCTAVVFAAVGFFDSFSLPLVLGCAVGYVLSVGNFYFMSVGVTAALETGEETAAKRKLRTSYIVRTVVILAVLIGSILLSQNFGIINWIPVAASVFYMRIVISARGVINYFMLKHNPPAADPDTDAEKTESGESKDITEDEDEVEEDTDEFEKFVGHFAKGPIPGKADRDTASEKK